jgi:flagellar basal-body rod protein FlgB
MIDPTGSVIYAALNALAARQRVIANNVANVETPGFIAGRVSFEDSLRAAVADGPAGVTSVSTRRSADPVNVNGNNVSLDNEVVSLTETDLAYQLMIQALNQNRLPRLPRLRIRRSPIRLRGPGTPSRSRLSCCRSVLPLGASDRPSACRLLRLPSRPLPP